MVRMRSEIVREGIVWLQPISKLKSNDWLESECISTYRRDKKKVKGDE